MAQGRDRGFDEGVSSDFALVDVAANGTWVNTNSAPRSRESSLDMRASPNEGAGIGADHVNGMAVDAGPAAKVGKDEERDAWMECTIPQVSPSSGLGDPLRRDGRVVIPLSDIGRAIERVCAVRHYSRRTSGTYVYWARRFVMFHGRRHPAELGTAEVSDFISDLAVAGQVAAATQNQALNALVFLYAQVLERPLPEGSVRAVRAKRPLHLPTVLSREQVAAFFRQIAGVSRLVALLQYGGGLRLMEGLRLRVKDLDLNRRLVLVRSGKGGKDRMVPLPGVAVDPLTGHLAARHQQYVLDRERGEALVHLPYALARKAPSMAGQWAWQYVFASSRTSRDPEDGVINLENAVEINRRGRRGRRDKHLYSRCRIIRDHHEGEGDEKVPG